jgi:hypothetical protein
MCLYRERYLIPIEAFGFCMYIIATPGLYTFL